MTFTLKIEHEHLQKTNTVAYTLNNIFNSLILTDINSEVKGQLSIYAQNVNIYRILHGCEKIWILCSSGKNNISRVSAANE